MFLGIAISYLILGTHWLSTALTSRWGALTVINLKDSPVCTINAIASLFGG